MSASRTGGAFAVAACAAALTAQALVPAPFASTAAKATAGVDPCSLIGITNVESITGLRVLKRAEAPLGPTCIYTFKHSRKLVTVAYGPGRFSALAAQIRRHQRRRFSVRGHLAYCGKLGPWVLYVSLPNKRVLTIGATCAVAERLAVIAVRRL